MGYEMTAGAVGNAIGSALQNFAEYSSKAAARANGISKIAQTDQGNFNQGSANIANALGTDRILDQYVFNSGQAAMANQFTSDMWDRSAAWNEAMWERTAAWNEEMMQRQMDFNAAEAQKNRDWQQKMAETSYQRAVADMEKAGINPILASGGVSVGGGSGSMASVGGTSIGFPSMSSAQGAMASGGLMNGLAASEGNYTGQMEYMAGTLGLLSAAISGISSAMGAFGNLGDMGKSLGKAFGEILKGSFTIREGSIGDKINNYYEEKQRKERIQEKKSRQINFNYQNNKF